MKGSSTAHLVQRRPEGAEAGGEILSSAHMLRLRSRSVVELRLSSLLHFSGQHTCARQEQLIIKGSKSRIKSARRASFLQRKVSKFLGG